MSTIPDRDELFQLFGGLSNDMLNAAQHVRLEEILAGSAEARRLWFLYCDMERGLVRRSTTPEIAAGKITPLPTTKRLAMKWALAASVVFMALIGALMFVSSGTASAAAVVREALKVHSALLDRCYRVELRGERDAASAPRQESLLCTRGDRFWNQIQTDEKTVAWGRDEADGVWFALSPREGARLAANEVPEALEAACELRSLRVESLLREVLADFDLRREPASAGTELIHATPRPGQASSRYATALFEVDARSHVLRRVELHRAHQGRAVAVVSFTLVGSELQDDARYTLEGHLDPDGVIYDRNTGHRKRGPLIAEFLRLIRAR